MSVLDRRVKLDAPGTRIQWDKPTRDLLAKETAKTLVAWDCPFPPSTRDMMRAFRAVQSVVVPRDKQRDITGPTRVPWLRNAVIDAVQEIRREEEAAPPSLPTPPEHPAIITADDVGLILDALTGMDQKLDEFFAVQRAHEAAITSLTAAVRSLGEIVVRQRKRAAERQAEKERLRALTPPTMDLDAEPEPEPVRPIRIIVAGIEKGSQKAEIENTVKGFSHVLEVVFVDATRPPSHLARFDQLILMKFLPQSWRGNAERAYPARTHQAQGIRTAIDLIFKFAQQPDKYRAESY